MNKFLKISVWVLTVAAIACLWYFAHKEHVEHPLKRLELTLMRNNEDGFIDKSFEYQKIMNICDTAVNNDITKIPVDEVRDYIKSIPWATYTEANLTLDEFLVVNIIECQPIMRVYNKDGNSVYLDEDGSVYPISENYTPHLLIGSGNLKFKALKDKSGSIYDDEFAKSDLPKIFNVMKSVLNNSYSNCCVKQVYFNGKNYELVMNNVELKVILGDDQDVDEKLLNMKYFFEQMQGSPDLKNYSKISFNYLNQVVCTKNKNKNIR